MMCKECGCGLPGKTPAGVSAHHHEHDHAHSHDHTHTHTHEHDHGPGHHHGERHEHSHSHPHTHEHEHDESHAHEHDTSGTRRVLDLNRAILEKNDRLAERNRGFFRARNLLALNVLSSPGSGKTTLLKETLRRTAPSMKSAVIVGDLATDNDAQRLRETGTPVVQVTTGTVCHLESEMVARALKRIDLEGLQLLFIENVGNLVCPAAFDLGEDLRVVLFSVTEGEDKPLKYPPLFQSANVVIISKSDLASACAYDRSAALANLKQVAPKAHIFETSAKTGQGMDEWIQFLTHQHAHRSSDPWAP